MHYSFFWKSLAVFHHHHLFSKLGLNICSILSPSYSKILYFKHLKFLLSCVSFLFYLSQTCSDNDGRKPVDSGGSYVWRCDCGCRINSRQNICLRSAHGSKSDQGHIRSQVVGPSSLFPNQGIAWMYNIYVTIPGLELVRCHVFLEYSTANTEMYALGRNFKEGVSECRPDKEGEELTIKRSIVHRSS